MSFSVTLTVQRTGRMLLPRASSGALSIVFPAFACRVLTNVSVLGGYPAVIVPVALRALMVLPAVIQVEITAVESGPNEPTLEPLEDAFEFVATPRLNRASAHVTVPMSWARSITAWRLVRVFVGDYQAVVELRSNVQGIRGVVVPAEFVGVSQRIRLVRVDALAPEAASADPTVFDWGVIPFEGKRVLEGKQMLVPTQRSQLVLKRLTPIESTMWLLGFWLADGDKEALWFTITNKSRLLLGKARDALLALGVTVDDLMLSVIHGTASRVRSEAYFAPLGIQFGAVRADLGHQRGATLVQREFSGGLSLRGSAEFVGLARQAVKHLALETRTREARQAFLMGFLDGDGTVIMGKPPRLSASCATLDEANLIAGLMDEYLGRESISVAHEEGGCFPVNRTLTGFAAARLINDGAFQANMARPKLFHFAHRVLYPERFMGLHHRWGFVDEHDQPTDQLNAARALLDKHAHEWTYIQEVYPTEDDASPGHKGVLYEYDQNWKQSSWQKIRRRQAENAPELHHPREKQAQIREVLVGLTGLRIYEAHAGEGGCTAAYAEFGDVVARTHTGGDAVAVLHAQLADPTMFDVVDLDPYGYPFNLLLEGTLRLLKPNGFLFVTCPNPAKNYRGGSKRIQATLFPHGPNPFDAGAIAELVGRLGILRGLDLALVDQLNLPTVWRFAFRSAKL